MKYPNYTLDENALWCMNRALELGAKEVVFFCNSAPDSMTINGKPHSDKQKKKVTNLAPENYQAFADYVLDAVITQSESLAGEKNAAVFFDIACFNRVGKGFGRPGLVNIGSKIAT